MRLQTTHTASLIGRAWLTRRMLRVTLSGPDLQEIRARPAQDLELLLEDRGRAVKRRYTIRQLRPDVGELDIDVVLHDAGGPGSAWASSAALGSSVEFIGPKGKLELLEADWHLFVGDEAGLPAIAALTEALGPRATTVALLEIDGPAEGLPIAASVLRWLHRNGSPPGTTGLLAGALEQLRAPGGLGRAYLLGESHAVHGLRGQLEAIGIGSDRAFVKGYWNTQSPARPD